uniref:Secretory peptide n=1 Tax=Heteropoda venatoria TaxID=152925 RepID=A0A088BP95_HETVE|nr:secretory peptide [Heteropoda venatoria]
MKNSFLGLIFFIAFVNNFVTKANGEKNPQQFISEFSQLLDWQVELSCSLPGDKCTSDCDCCINYVKCDCESGDCVCKESSDASVCERKKKMCLNPAAFNFPDGPCLVKSRKKRIGENFNENNAANVA